MRKLAIILGVLLLSFPVHSQEKFVVYFDFGKEVLNESSNIEFENWLNANDNLSITGMSGFCDSVGSASSNLKLANRRIRSVAGILEQNEIPISKAVVLQPIGENFKQFKSSADNRKVEIYYETLNGKSAAKSEDDFKPSAIKSPIALEKQFSKVRKGDIIKIENINFHLDSEEVVIESQPLLFELVDVLKNNPGLKIEIHGHICCNTDINDTQLSFRRAKFIFIFLRNQGIDLNRLGFKGFGSSRPIYKIPEQSLAQERANRRVEILVTENKKP